MSGSTVIQIPLVIFMGREGVCLGWLRSQLLPCLLFFFFFADEKTQNVLEGLHIQSGPGRPSEKLESVAGEKDVWNTLLSPSATTT